MLFLLEFDDEPLNVFLLRDPNEVLEGSGVLFSNSSTLSGFSSMVTGLTLEAAGLILDLNLDLLARDPKNNDKITKSFSPRESRHLWDSQQVGQINEGGLSELRGRS